jgi:hypothetical protein
VEKEMPVKQKKEAENKEQKKNKETEKNTLREKKEKETKDAKEMNKRNTQLAKEKAMSEEKKALKTGIVVSLATTAFLNGHYFKKKVGRALFSNEDNSMFVQEAVKHFVLTTNPDGSP